MPMRAVLLTLLSSVLFSLSPIASAMSDADYMASMASMHASDMPVPSPVAVQKPAQPVTGAEVVYATVGGKEIRGYLTKPASAKGPLPGIIVVHEWWGLNDNIRRTADRLAGEGYEALAVDLYDGTGPGKTSDEAKKLMLTMM